MIYFVQKVTEEKYDVSVSSIRDEIVVQQQSEPHVTCTISLTSPSVKDDLQEAGKYSKLHLHKLKHVFHSSLRSVCMQLRCL